MLEKLLNDEKFKELSEYLEKKKNESFNIFKVLRLQDYEVRHSNFLAWLFDPSASHGLGTAFLENCLNLCFEEKNINIDKDIKVETEYLTDKNRRIDILISSDDFIYVIENKYGSDEHNGQCQHYKEFIENKNEFKNKSKKFIFLDIYEPEEEQFQEGQPLNGYKTLTYDKIYNVINNLKLKENIQTQIIKQYSQILKEKYESYDDIAFNFCREICTTHKDKMNSLKDYDTSLLSGIEAEGIDLLKNFINWQLPVFTGNILKEIVNELGLHTTWSSQTGIAFYSKDFYLNAYLQILTSKNKVVLELVVKNGTDEEKDLLKFLSEKFKNKKIRNYYHDGFSIIDMKTLISESNYYDEICKSKEKIKDTLKLESEKFNTLISTIFKEYINEKQTSYVIK